MITVPADLSANNLFPGQLANNCLNSLQGRKIILCRTVYFCNCSYCETYMMYSNKASVNLQFSSMCPSLLLHGRKTISCRTAYFCNCSYCETYMMYSNKASVNLQFSSMCPSLLLHGRKTISCRTAYFCNCSYSETSMIYSNKASVSLQFFSIYALLFYSMDKKQYHAGLLTFVTAPILKHP